MLALYALKNWIKWIWIKNKQDAVRLGQLSRWQIFGSPAWAQHGAYEPPSSIISNPPAIPCILPSIHSKHYVLLQHDVCSFGRAAGHFMIIWSQLAARVPLFELYCVTYLNRNLMANIGPKRTSIWWMYLMLKSDVPSCSASSLRLPEV